MSLIYSILKPVLRKASAKRAVMTREDFAELAIKKQRRGVTTVRPSFIMQEADI